MDIPYNTSARQKGYRMLDRGAPAIRARHTVAFPSPYNSVQGLVVLLILLFCFSGVQAQQADLRPYVNEGTDCVSKDVRLISARLNNEEDCSTCETGKGMELELLMTLEHNTNSDRPALAVFGDLEITYPDGRKETRAFSRCSGPLAPKGRVYNNSPVASGGNGVQTLSFGVMEYECGTRLEIQNILVVWTVPSDGECPIEDTNPHPKCGFQAGPMIIIPPLQGTTVSACDPTSSIDLTVQGGTAPYTYEWTGPDGFTATSEDLDDVEAGNYTVTITDAEGCALKVKSKQNDCCEFYAASALSSRTHELEGCGVADLPEAYADYKEVFRQITKKPCGQLQMTFEEHEEQTPDGLQVVRTYTLFDDLNGNQGLDPDEESAVASETYLLTDTTAPVFTTTLPSDLRVSCEEVPVAETLEVADRCDSQIAVSYSETRADSECSSSYTLTRTWSATDSAGNAVEHRQLIEVVDEIPPVFNESLPADTVAAFDAVPDPELVTARDGCSDSARVTFSESYEGDPSGTTYVLLREWTARDCAGNQTKHTQRIYVTENGDPIGIRIDDIQLTENDGTARFAIRLTGEFQDGFTIDYRTQDGSAVSPADYAALPPTSLYFEGNHGETAYVTVTVNDDDVVEASEMFSLRLSDSSAPGIPINDDDGKATLFDNDTATITFENISVNEGEGTAILEMLLNGNVQETFTLDFETSSADASAMPGMDYVSASGTLSWPAEGRDGDRLPILITILDDEVIEFTENFLVLLSELQGSGAITIATPQANVELLDNDGDKGSGVAFTSQNVIVNEDEGTAVFPVQLNGQTAFGFTVSYTTLEGNASGGSDYQTTTGTLNFSGQDGEQKYIEVPILDDNLIEPTEGFTVFLSNLSTDLISLNGDTANGSILDNDGGNGSGLSFNAVELSVSEGSGIAVFEVLLTGNVQGGFTLDYQTQGESAMAGEDFQAASGTLTFEGHDGETQLIEVVITDDELIEVTEGFSVLLSDLSTDLIALNEDSAQVAILDNDAVNGTGISFDTTNISVDEAAGVAVFDVVLSGNVQDGFTLDYQTQGGSATAGEDFQAATGTLNFEGYDGEIQQLTVSVTDDNLIEATETFDVILSGLSTNLIPLNGAITNASIIDNDLLAGTGISMKQTGIVVDEGVGQAIVEVVLNGAVANAFSVDYQTQAASAMAGMDFEMVTGTLQFEGTDGETRQILIPILEDELIEAKEHFSVGLSSLSTPLIDITVPETTVEILDNDTIEGSGIAVDLTEVIVDEDAGAATFVISLSGMVQDAFNLSYFIEGGTARQGMDFGETYGNLAFSGTDGERYEITVPVIDDILVEETEQFTLHLSVDNPVVPLQDTTARGLIRDNDQAALNEPDLVAACDDVPEAKDPVLVAKGCAYTVDFSETITRQDESCATQYTLSREWVVTDCVGNKRSFTRVIQVKDEEGPEFNESLPENLSVSCDAIPVAATLTATDNCDPDIEVVFEEELVGEGNCALGYLIRRTWTATDCAGNTTEHVQEIQVEAKGPITASSYQEEVTVACGEALPLAPEMEFQGGCGDYSYEFNSFRSEFEGSADYVIVREWIVTDSCGNEERFEQQVLVLQPERELVFIDRCVTDPEMELFDYLPDSMGRQGTFILVSGQGGLNGSRFDPAGLETGVYQIAYEDTEGDCKYYADIAIAVHAECVPCRLENVIPSRTVTANGDGVNDHFEIGGVEYCDFTFQLSVFNRWGAKVYEARDYQNNWGGSAPGTSFGSNGMLPTGTYYYIIQITNREDLEPINGYIYLGTK